MKKKLVRLTESDLHRIIENSVRKILKEDNLGFDNDIFDLYQKIKDEGHDDEVIRRLMTRVGPMEFRKILNDIASLYLNVDEDEPIDRSSHFDEQGYFDDDNN